MTLDWSLYPTSGRTQWFGAVHANRPSGVGFGYSFVTSHATGLYAYFNTDRTVITTELASEEDLNWESATTPPGFTAAPLLNRKINPITNNNEWVLFIPRDMPGQTIIVAVNQSFPNLRNPFIAPPAADPFGDPIPELPDPWMFMPLTRHQATNP